MANIDTWGFTRDPRGRKTRMEPSDPDRVLQIVHLRDKTNMSWRQIGELLGMSHQGPYLLYKRWHIWAKKTAA